ncbi:MAG: RHS repeat-associated core domain-containing protein [Acidimicrobiales bacterium]
MVTCPTYSPPGGGSNITPTEGYDYDDVGRVTAFTDRRGYTTDFTYDDLGHRLTQTDPEARVGDGRGVTTFTYDLLGNVESVTDPTGAVTTYTYDTLYRRTSMTQEVRPQSIAVGGGTHTVADEDFITDYTYDILGRPTGESVPRVSGTAVWTTTTYDSLGYPASVTDPDGRTVDYRYDRLGRLQDVEDALGRATEYDYDMAGRQTVIRREDADGDTAAETTFTYDADGNPTTVTDPLGNDTDYTYDALGRLTAVDEPLTSGTATTSYGYDAAGNMTRMVDANSNTTTYTYNVWNLPETTVEPSTTAHPNVADRTFTTVYDGGGLPTSQIQPGPVTVVNVYDGLGRLYDQSSLSGGDREFTHDLVGRILTVSHPGTGDQEFVYDDRGLLAVAKGPAGDVTYDYDDAARVTGRDDAAGTHTYTWTPAGLLDTLSDPLTGLDADWTYNTAGDVTNIEYDNGSTTFDRSFGYDAVGRLVEDTQTDTAANVEARTRMAFDPRGDLTYETLDLPANSAAGGVSSYGYDPADRLTQWARTDAPEVLLVVGNASSPDSSDDDLQARLEESFAANVTVRDDNSSQTIAGYDLVVVATSVLEADLGTKYGKNADIAVVNLAGHTWDEHELTDTQATYSAAEREVIVADAAHPLAASLVGAEDATTTVRAMQHAALTDLGSGAKVAIHHDPANSEALAFTYDTGKKLADNSNAPARRAAVGYGRFLGDYAIDLLSDAGWRLFDNAVAWALADPDTADITTYAYDDVGNRTSVTLPDTTVETFTYDQRNRVLSDPDGDYTWTARGTLLEFDDGVDQTVYAYNGLGELATVQTPTATVNYTYDGLGRLAERNGASAEFEFAGFDADPTYDGDSRYSRLPGGTLFAVDDGTDANLAVLNRHGDLQHLTDPANGNPDATQITDPWGTPVTSTGTNPDIGYQGDYTDPETGLVNMGARWYDPDTGTFTSRDTYSGDTGSPKTTNRYLYGNANPNKHWDPTGMAAQPMEQCLANGGTFDLCESNDKQFRDKLDRCSANDFASCHSLCTAGLSSSACAKRDYLANVTGIAAASPAKGPGWATEELGKLEDPLPKGTVDTRDAAPDTSPPETAAPKPATTQSGAGLTSAQIASEAYAECKRISDLGAQAKCIQDTDRLLNPTQAAAKDIVSTLVGLINVIRLDTARQASEYGGAVTNDLLADWYDGNVSANDVNAACNNNLYGADFQNLACDLQGTGDWKSLQTKCSGSWTCNVDSVGEVAGYVGLTAAVAGIAACLVVTAGTCAAVVGPAVLYTSLGAGAVQVAEGIRTDDESLVFQGTVGLASVGLGGLGTQALTRTFFAELGPEATKMALPTYLGTLTTGLGFSFGQLVVRRGIGLVGQGGAASSDFGDDVVGRLGPHERSRVLVPV